jgi:alkylation response protein AidB-like acyl-CoA dehydrogenase
MQDRSHGLAAPTGAANILANARQLGPWLQSQSNEIESARQLGPAVVERLTAAGVFRMNMPRLWGGPEISSPEQVQIIETLASADASAAWCAMIGADAGLYSGYLDDATGRDLYPHLDMVQAGWVYPVGRAEEVKDGYKVSGNWLFCSGSSHADMIVAGCTVFRQGQAVLDANGQPEWRLMLAPADNWLIADTWHTTGLRGTASNDYSTLSKYLLVPREHSFSFAEPKRSGTLWARPDASLRKMAGVPLGVARQAIDQAQAVLLEKRHRLSGVSFKQAAVVQAGIAEAEMLLGGARAYVYAALETQWQLLEQNQPLTDRQRADVWLSRLNAFQVARDVTRLLYDLVGADSIYTCRSSLDRNMRDAQTMCQHMVGQRKGLADIGSLLMGVDSEFPRSIMI